MRVKLSNIWGLLVADVCLDRQLAEGAGVEVDADHPRSLCGEQLRGRGAYAAGGSGDHADLPLQSSGHCAQLPSVE